MSAKKAKKAGSSTKAVVRRFVVLSGDHYYPNGGWDDYRSSHDTLDDARSAPAPGDWSQIVDLRTGKIVGGSRS